MHRPASPSPTVKQFDSKLIDEYLRSINIVQAPVASSPVSSVQTAILRPGSAAVGTSQALLPLIHEGVEDVGEADAMDGEEEVLSPSARLMYYGHTRSRSSRGQGRRSRSGSPRASDVSPARTKDRRSVSPPGLARGGGQAGGMSPGRSLSPHSGGTVRPLSAVVQQSRPLSAVPVQPSSSRPVSAHQGTYSSRAQVPATFCATHSQRRPHSALSQQLVKCYFSSMR